MADFNYQALVQEAKDSGASTTYEPLPNGEYNVVVDKAEAKQSKKGDPQLVIVFKVTDGPFKGRLMWQYMTFIPGNSVGLAINFRQLDTLGATPILEQGGSLAQVGGFLTGKSAIVKTEQRIAGEKVFNDVKDIKKGVASGVPTAGGFNPSPSPAPAPALSGAQPF